MWKPLIFNILHNMKILDIAIILCNVMLSIIGMYIMWQRVFGDMEFEKFATIMFCIIFSLISSYTIKNS